jgi:hypothetical protein
MSSSTPNMLSIKKRYHLNIDLLDDIGAIGMENAPSWCKV